MSGTPAKVSKRPVPDKSGLMLLMRIWCGAYSEARPFVACGGEGGSLVGGYALGRGKGRIRGRDGMGWDGLMEGCES